MMNCGCQGKKRAQNASNQQTRDSPLQIQLVKMLGLKNFLLDKFVFRRKTPTYTIRHFNSRPLIHIGNDQYLAPDFYRHSATIIEIEGHSVPIVQLFPKDHQPLEPLPCIIYAHGNSSDLGDALGFLSRFADKFKAHYIAFDYTGYGESRCKEVGEEVICRDLQLVLAWINQPLQNVILWGFSLGTYPVVYNAAKYKVKACILQCPIGSLSCMFYDEYATNVKFKDDHFANIDHIANIDCKILMMHSQSDQIIPIEQARLLYSKFIHKNKGREHEMEFLEVQKIKHNSFHRFLTSPNSNDLQLQVIDFLERVTVVPTIPTLTTIPNEEQNNLYFQQTKQPFSNSKISVGNSSINLTNSKTPSSFNNSKLSQHSSNPKLPQQLVKIRSKLKQSKLEQYFFDQSQYQLVQNEPREGQKVGQQPGWLCCNR